MQNVIAAADANLIGKTFEEGKYFLQVKESFYKGERINAQDLAKKLKDFNNINLVGEKCVSIALKEGICSEKNILKIAGIPHLQIYRI